MIEICDDNTLIYTVYSLCKSSVKGFVAVMTEWIPEGADFRARNINNKETLFRVAIVGDSDKSVNWEIIVAYRILSARQLQG